MKNHSLFLIIGFALILGFSSGSAAAADGIDPEADKVLKSMSIYLEGLSTFRMTADIDNEIIHNDGRKLQFSAFSFITMERPNKFHISRKGMLSNAEFFFNGTILTVYGKDLNAYVQFDEPGTIEDAILTLESEIGLDAPGADLLFTNSYDILTENLVRSEYIGVAYVDGAPCHHLSFRQTSVDWQIWVKTGDAPLPMKYVITSKWVTGAPQYAIRMHNWDTTTKIEEKQFKFSAPKGATKIREIFTNALGELRMEEEESK